MCDTFAAAGDFTGTGNIIFGKNSDREPDEAQHLVRIPAAAHKSRLLKTTYIEIPQVKRTFMTILSKPFQMWGAEMGVNEKNLVIGNEAVFTRFKAERRNTGLTGMDMIRLALERCDNAGSAVELITNLIEQYGQDACGGYRDRKFFYSNSFLIADRRRIFVLESAGRHWAFKEIRGFHAISNGLTLENDYDSLSPQAIEEARRHGWLKPGEEFSFRRAFSDRFFTHFSHCRARRSLSEKRNGAHRGNLTVADAMNTLRSHAEEPLHPEKESMSSLCVHATGLLTPSQTTGSLVAEIRPRGESTFWFTGTAAPCLSLYKPFFLKSRILTDSTAPGPTADSSLWWRHEKLHRRLLAATADLREAFRGERDELESGLRNAEKKLQRSFSGRAASTLSESALAREDALREKFLRMTPDPSLHFWKPSHRLWQKLAQRAGALREARR